MPKAVDLTPNDDVVTHFLPKSRWENPATVGEMVCTAKGSSHLLDRSLLKERNKRISSRYVNVNLQREKERKKKQTLKQRAG